MISIADMQKSFVFAWVTKLMQPGYVKVEGIPTTYVLPTK